MDMFAGIWLADYVGSFLNAGGNGVYYFHYLPLQMEHGCNDSPGTFGMFTVDINYQIQQPLSQFFVSQLINLEWVQPGSGEHLVFPAQGDIDDGGGHALVTAYAVKRPDGQWSVMAVNRDQWNAHSVKISFNDRTAHGASFFSGMVEVSTFGKNQYQWHPAETQFLAHSEHAGEQPVVAITKGMADPDGPIMHSRQTGGSDAWYDLPAASVVVIRGKVAGR
jgi:hypothetical protein